MSIESGTNMNKDTVLINWYFEHSQYCSRMTSKYNLIPLANGSSITGLLDSAETWLLASPGPFVHSRSGCHLL